MIIWSSKHPRIDSNALLELDAIIIDRDLDLPSSDTVDWADELEAMLDDQWNEMFDEEGFETTTVRYNSI